MTAIRNAMTAEEREQAGGADPETGRWSQAEHLLAGIADRIARLEYVTILAHSSGNTTVKPPEAIPRPGVGGKPAQRSKKPLSEADAEELWARISA